MKFQPSLLRISFGKGPDDFWTNVFKSPLTSRSDIQADIRKFGRVLKLIHKMEPIFVFIPVHRLLSLFRFSKDFGEKLIYPLVGKPTLLFLLMGSHLNYYT